MLKNRVGHLSSDRLEEVRDVTEKASVQPNAPSLTNGTAAQEGPHSAPYVNGLREGTVTLTFLGFSEAEPGQGVCDDDTAIIRAERVTITDEGEEEPAEEPREESGEESGEEPSADRRKEKAEPGGTENHLEGSVDINHEEQVSGTEGEEINTETNAGPRSGSSEDPGKSPASTQHSFNSFIKFHPYFILLVVVLFERSLFYIKGPTSWKTM